MFRVGCEKTYFDSEYKVLGNSFGVAQMTFFADFSWVTALGVTSQGFCAFVPLGWAEEKRMLSVGFAGTFRWQPKPSVFNLKDSDACCYLWINISLLLLRVKPWTCHMPEKYYIAIPPTLFLLLISETRAC